MPKIENCSIFDFMRGHHKTPAQDAIAIQILDPGDTAPEPKADVFASRHIFRFLDAEDSNRFFKEKDLIGDEQAQEIARILNKALAEDRNVLVHCTVGVCRSGAVVEVAEMIGFDECGRYRHPNQRVKKKLMQALGLLEVNE